MASDDLKGRLRADLITARKQRDKPRTLVLSTVLADLRYREIADGSDADDETVVEVVSKAIKQRKDAASQMREGGRAELAEAEEAQVEVLASYLPEGLGEDQVRALVREAIESGLREMGPLMGAVMPKIKGRFDGKEANRIVREELAG